MTPKTAARAALTGSLSRRERQIVDILHRRREASAEQVRRDLDDPPSYDAVRTTLRILTDKGIAIRRSEGTKYVYAPAVDPATARVDALSHLVRTFFHGSTARAALALLRDADLKLDESELARIEKKISEAESR